MLSASEILQGYRSLPVETWGPQRAFGGVTKSPEEWAWLMAELREMWAAFEARDMPPGGLSAGRTYTVPDAATAALLLHLDQEICVVEGRPTAYRGQAAHPDWTLESSWERTARAPLDVRLTELYGSLLFELVLERIDWVAGSSFQKAWVLDSSERLVMARHHGMASPFVDLTVDPSVAVLFARSQARARGLPTAKVYRFSVEELGERAALTLPLPPMLRSVRQYGIYFNTVADSPGPCQLRAAEAAIVCFPSDSEFDEETSLLRDGERVDLMHSDPLLEAIERAVRATTQRMDVFARYDPDEQRLRADLAPLAQEVLSIVAANGLLSRQGDRYRYSPTGATLREWFKHVSDIVHSFCGITYHTQGTPLDTRLLERFVDHNLLAVQIYLLIYAGAKRGTELDAIMPVIRILNARLLTVSRGYAGIFSQEFLPPGFSAALGKVVQE